jgi:DNA-binding CsgD family transcriptional regulator
MMAMTCASDKTTAAFVTKTLVSVSGGRWRPIPSSAPRMSPGHVVTGKTGGFRVLMDRWISSPDGLEDPATIYDAVTGSLRPTSILFVADVPTSGFAAADIDVIRPFGLPNGLPGGVDVALGTLPEIGIAVGRQRPLVGGFVRTVGGVLVSCDHLFLPQKKTSGPSRWCIGLLDVKFLLPLVAGVGVLDDTDLAILQLLREGASAKEIAAIAGLSFRTIQHRIERLKSRFGARSIAHLVALSISAVLAREDVAASEPEQTGVECEAEGIRALRNSQLR